MVQIRRENKFADHGDNGTRKFEAIDSTLYGWGGVDHKFLILINAKLYALRDVLGCGCGYDAFVTDTDVGLPRRSGPARGRGGTERHQPGVVPPRYKLRLHILEVDGGEPAAGGRPDQNTAVLARRRGEGERADEGAGHAARSARRARVPEREHAPEALRRARRWGGGAPRELQQREGGGRGHAEEDGIAVPVKENGGWEGRGERGEGRGERGHGCVCFAVSDGRWCAIATVGVVCDTAEQWAASRRVGAIGNVVPPAFVLVRPPPFGFRHHRERRAERPPRRRYTSTPRG